MGDICLRVPHRRWQGMLIMILNVVGVRCANTTHREEGGMLKHCHV